MRTCSVDILTNVPGVWVAASRAGVCLLEVAVDGAVFALDLNTFARCAIIPPGSLSAEATFIGPLQRGQVPAVARGLRLR